MIGQQQTNTSWAVIGYLLPCLTLAACDSGKPAVYPVTGVVKFEDGSPVTSGVIEFLSVERQLNARGTIDEQGRFALTTFRANDGAVAGRHDVVILQTFAPDALGEVKHNQPHRAASAPRIVDPALSSYETTTLFGTVKAQPNHIEFRVRGQGLTQ